jgi:hypothetical protein
MSNFLEEVITWGEAVLDKLFKKIPTIVKQYGTEAISICNTIKTALASPDAAAIETALAQLIKGNWESEVITAIEKALIIAIPELTALTTITGTAVDYAAAFVKFLQGLSPKMQRSGLLKLLSSIFQAIDPSLSEVEADTAAQVAYAKSTATA